jgi:hypothetical protein
LHVANQSNARLRGAEQHRHRTHAWQEKIQVANSAQTQADIEAMKKKAEE